MNVSNASSAPLQTGEPEHPILLTPGVSNIVTFDIDSSILGAWRSEHWYGQTIYGKHFSVTLPAHKNIQICLGPSGYDTYLSIWQGASKWSEVTGGPTNYSDTDPGSDAQMTWDSSIYIGNTTDNPINIFIEATPYRGMTALTGVQIRAQVY